MAWISVCQLSDFVSQDWLTYRVGEKDLILFQLETGEPVCFIDRCSHQDVRLSDFGRRSHDRLLCLAHGAIFSLTDGAPLKAPACEALSQVPCRLQNQQVEVQLDNVGAP